MGTEVMASEETETKPSELEAKIIRQVEYYFGNYNLSKDKFLKNEIKNDDGWVSLETMLKFNRLKELTEDSNTVSEALKKSPNQLMEINDDCTKIRRKVPLPEKTDKGEIEDRTLYVKGFGKNKKLDEILDFFQGHKVENVQMRRRKLGKSFVFKGSVFATFQTKEDSENFLNTPGQKFEKMTLLKERKKEYVKRKDIFYDNLRAEKAKKMEERKEHDEVNSKGCLLRLSGLGGTEITRKHIKETLESFGKVAFVDFHDGDEKAIVRFDKGVVNDILKEAKEDEGEKKLEINSIKVTASLIDGEEEEKYLEVVSRNKAAAKARNQQGYRGKFDKKNRGRFQKRNRDDDERQRPNKKAKGENENKDNGENENKDCGENEHKEQEKSENCDCEPPAKKPKTDISEESSEKSSPAKETNDIKEEKME